MKNNVQFKMINDILVFYNRELDVISLDSSQWDSGLAYDRTPVNSIYDMCFEVTSKCNQHCNNCFSSSSYHSNTYDELFIDTINNMIEKFENKVIRVTISGGEPFLHSSICSILDLPCKYDNINFVINTNGGILFSDNQTDMLIKNDWLVAVSLHGNLDTHNSYTNSSSFKTVINNIEKLSNKTIIHIYSVLNKYTGIKDILFLFALCKEYKINYLRFIIPRKYGRYEYYPLDEIISNLEKLLGKDSTIKAGIKYTKSKTMLIDVHGNITDIN